MSRRNIGNVDRVLRMPIGLGLIGLQASGPLHSALDIAPTLRS